MRELSSELRFACRRLRSTPAFTLFSIVTLALGIGATTAIYSVVYAAFLRPPALKDPDRVANLYQRDPRSVPSLPMIALSPADYLDYKTSQTSFEHLAAWARFLHSLVADGVAELVSGEMVGGDYFSVVGIDAALGRTLQPADDRPGAARVIVLSHTLWRLRFGADPRVVGRTVNLGGDTFLLSADLQLAPGYAMQFAPEFNVSVAAVACGSTLLALLVFGVIPALHGARANVREALASDVSGAGTTRWRGRRNLIACEVAVSAGLVSVAVLCAQQVIATARHESGLDLDHIAAASVDFRMQKKDETYGRRVLDEVLHLARLQPGVESVAASSGLPMGIGTPGATVAATDERRPSGMLTGAYAELVAATPDIFRALGIDLVAGRAFDERDTATSGAVVILNRTMAKGIFGETDPVGREVVVQRRQWVGEDVPAVQVVTVVGIAQDTDVGSVGRRDGSGVVYRPFAQHYEPAVTIVARSLAESQGHARRVAPDGPARRPRHRDCSRRYRPRARGRRLTSSQGRRRGVRPARRPGTRACDGWALRSDGGPRHAAHARNRHPDGTWGRPGPHAADGPVGWRTPRGARPGDWNGARHTRSTGVPSDVHPHAAGVRPDGLPGRPRCVLPGGAAGVVSPGAARGTSRSKRGVAAPVEGAALGELE